MSCDAELGIVLKWVFIGFRICKNSIYSHREIGIYDSVYCNQPHRHLWQIWNKASLLQASPMVLNVKHFLYPKSAWCCLSSLPTLDNNLLLKPTHCTCLNNMILDTDWIMHLSVSAIYLLIWWVKFFLPLERSEDMWLVKMGPILTVVTIGQKNLCSHSDLPTEWIDCC